MTRHGSRKNQMSVLGLRAAALLAAAVAGSGCAESIGDIDRTQPDLIAKKHFEGQWYLRETVVDVPETSPTAFVGLGSDMEMLVWEIQQDYLVGYRAYEQVPGIDHNAASGLARPSFQPLAPEAGEGRDKELYKGAPVVAYRIEAHVDVQRGYNSRTGEQNNIISENTSDRPWQERAFMRVDWSNNAVDNLMSLSPLFQLFATMSSFVPQNEGGADAFKIETDEDTGLANYIDFTLRYTAAPSVRSCINAQNQRLGDCTGEEIKIRTSMLKVDPEREQEYVPLVYDDRRQGEFGFFRTERPTYDRRLGNTFTGLIQLAGRHDLWERSRDASGVPLAFSARTLRPITYTLSENFPEDLLETAEQIGEEYDASFKSIAAAARGQTLAELQEDIENDTGGSCLYCLDLNVDNKARNGDLRRNFIYWVDQRQAAGPLGFGPSYPNPETARTVSANAYVYGAGVDTYAEAAKQMVELMIPENQGGLTEEEIVDASYFRDAVRGDLNPIDPRATARIQGLSGDALAKELLGDAGFERLAELARLGKDALPTAIPGLDQARLARLVGTELEAKMIPSEWARDQAEGKPNYLRTRAALLKKRAQELGETPPAEGPQGYLSVTNWFGPEAFKDQQEFENIANQHNVWLADFDDPAIGGLAREVIQNGWQGDDLFLELRKRIFRAVMLHEIGHTVGLRHNFAGSADALNYHDEYWEHRVKTIEPVARYTQGTAPAVEAFLRSNCAVQGPLLSAAAGNPPIAGTDVTELCDEQVTAQMSEKQYSSIMDYGARFNSDFHGLGHYDIAALGAGYGDLVEVFDDEAMAGIAAATQATGVPVRDAMMLANTVRTPILFQGLDNAIVQVPGPGMRLSHYTNYPMLMGGAENIAKRRFMARTEYLDLLNQAQNMTPAQRASLPVKVPYLSCYDEYVDSVETCHRYDLGADNYEIVANSLTGYREYYVFNNFHRDRIGFDPFQVAVRTAQRYFLPLTNMYQHWLWNRAITGLTPGGTPRGDLGLYATVGGLYRLLNTMSTPEYGAHIYDASVGQYVPIDGQCPSDVGDVFVQPSTDNVVGGAPALSGSPLMSMPMCVDVPRGVGRSFFSRYDSSGYDVFRRILESGHYYDQLAALAALQASNASVVGIGQDVNADARTFRIPYNLAFPEELEGIFSNIFREDDQGYALHIERNAAGIAQVVDRSVFTDPADTAALPVIAPGRSYTTRVQALVAGMNLLDGSLNTKFAKQGQISLVGSGEARTAPPGFTAVEIADPVSGRVFVAFRKADGTGGPWYAADLIEKAQRVAADPDAPDGELQSLFGDIELVRMAFNILGQ